MPRSQYNYAGTLLAQAGSTFDVQKQHMGILELDIDRLGLGGGGNRGSREVLILSLQAFTVPGRAIGVNQLAYLNGNINYPTRPEAQGNISVTFRDFPREGTRAIIEEWCSLVFDERTGLMLPSSLLKVKGHLILLQSDGENEREAELHGVFPTKRPDIAIDMGNGDALTMECEFACDRVIWKTLSIPKSTGT